MADTPFADRLAAFAEKIAARIPDLRRRNEDATKNALVLPFLKELGYDPFDPSEVDPEFAADVGIKKGERVDYAVWRGDAVVLLVECKKVGTKLADVHRGQLLRYFHVTDSARFALLTDGLEYRFFTDLDAPNRMDPVPFLRLDLRDLDGGAAEAVGMFEKPTFDASVARSAAASYRTRLALRDAVAAETADPSADIIRLFRDRVGGARPVADLEFSRMLREELAAVTASAGRPIVPTGPPMPPDAGGPPRAARKPRPAKDPAERRKAAPAGRRGLELDGQFFPANNVRGILSILFRKLSERDEDFLNRFAAEPVHGKGRRYLAAEPEALYPKSPHLTEKHSQKLSPGWWIDTNQGYASATRIVELAARVAGLRSGVDVKLIDER